jgi:uncharacterized membrane protein YgaE (UPF0421/DUF939 family)
MAIAATISWLIAFDLLGHTTTFFAPVASTIVLSIVPGERSRRAVEMVVGIAVGIGVADLIIQAIGSGALQIGIVVLLAVSVAILLGAGRVLASQAAATAVLVAALPASNQAFSRFTDALIGGLVGLVVLIVAPRNPVIPIRDEVESLLREVAGALGDAARALEQRDPAIAAAAIVRANGAGSLGVQFERMLRQGRETTLLAPAHWSSRIAVDRYEAAARHIDNATRDVGVLARSVRSLVESGEAPGGLAGAIRELAAAIEALAGHEPRDTDSDVIERALAAARLANACLAGSPSLAVGVIVAQIRAIAIDLLRALGAERLDASAHVRAAMPARPGSS